MTLNLENDRFCAYIELYWNLEEILLFVWLLSTEYFLLLDSNNIQLAHLFLSMAIWTSAASVLALFWIENVKKLNLSKTLGGNFRFYSVSGMGYVSAVIFVHKNSIHRQSVVISECRSIPQNYRLKLQKEYEQLIWGVRITSRNEPLKLHRYRG